MIDFITNIYFILPLFILLLFQLLFFFGLFSRFAFFKKVSIKNEPSVSVLIATKNEKENLENNLKSFLEQDYPDYEVIVIDDKSLDNTFEYLEQLEEKYSNLKIVRIKGHIRDYPGKKFALSLGIRKSTKDILLFTDADCKAVSNQWIRLMARNYSDNNQIVTGFSPYERKNSLLNLIIQFDTFYTALQYFSFTLASMPYMGVGRNLSYRKELFNKKGYATQLHVPYGDDDLFVNKNATENNISIEIDPDSFILSKPHTSLSKWFRQKKRHLKGGKEYKKNHKRWLAYLWLSHFAFYVAFAIAVIFNPLSYLIWGIFGIRFISSMIVYGFSMKKLKMLPYLWAVPFLDIFYHIIFVPGMSIISLFSNKKSW